MSPIKPIRYTLEVLKDTRWVALAGGYSIDEARDAASAIAKRGMAHVRITASLHDGRKVVLP